MFWYNHVKLVPGRGRKLQSDKLTAEHLRLALENCSAYTSFFAAFMYPVSPTMKYKDILDLNLRNRKHFPCFYWVTETRVEVWENEKCCGNTICTTMRHSWLGLRPRQLSRDRYLELIIIETRFLTNQRRVFSLGFFLITWWSLTGTYRPPTLSTLKP